MYVCLCTAVREREIESAIADGHDNLAALSAELGVGTGCGSCTDFIEGLLAQHGRDASFPADLAYNAANQGNAPIGHASNPSHHSGLKVYSAG